MFLTAFANDLEVAVEDAFAPGDRVAARWTARRTPEGPLRSIAPTGKRVVWLAIVFYACAGGKIKEVCGPNDAMGVMQQIGAIPSKWEGKQLYWSGAAGLSQGWRLPIAWRNRLRARGGRLPRWRGSVQKLIVAHAGGVWAQQGQTTSRQSRIDMAWKIRRNEACRGRSVGRPVLTPVNVG